MNHKHYIKHLQRSVELEKYCEICQIVLFQAMSKRHKNDNLCTHQVNCLNSNESLLKIPPKFPKCALVYYEFTCHNTLFETNINNTILKWISK